MLQYDLVVNYASTPDNVTVINVINCGSVGHIVRLAEFQRTVCKSSPMRLGGPIVYNTAHASPCTVAALLHPRKFACRPSPGAPDPTNINLDARGNGGLNALANSCK